MNARMARSLAGAMVLLALVGPPRALEGQVTGLPDRAQPPAQVRVAPMTVYAAPGGWLGFRLRFEVTETSGWYPGSGAGGSDRSHRIQVEEVVREGPARAAGMLPGDWILRINGMDAGQAIEAGILAGVRPGQVVQFGIERDGSARQVRVVAAPRPASATPTTASALARVRTDSIVSHMLVRMDSARVHVAREAVALSVPLPESQVDRRALVATRSGFPVDSAFTLGGEARATRSSAATLRALVSGRASASQREMGATTPSGPILVYATGQRAVLGAEVTPLNPGLAGYFGVNTGLLVTQVVEGAPGARGGLTPGDVIVRVGSDSVSTVEEFRAAAEAGFRSPPLVVGVVREGRRLELRIPR